MIKYLTLGPAGMGYYALLGAVHNLQEKQKLTNLQEISGASAGALLGFMYCLYRGNMKKCLEKSLDIDIESNTKINLQSFLNNYGFIDFTGIRSILQGLGGKNLTMRELFTYSKIKLHVASYCVTEGKTVYFSVDTHPSALLEDVLCASMAVPFIFSSVQIDNKLYVDGGVEEVIPATPFLSKKHEDVKALEVNMKKGTQVTDIASFSKQILGSLIKNRVHFENINNTLINLEEYDVLDFKMKDITKLELYVRGYLTNG
jgi:predicted acylesterase/phospholipase RssA